MSSSFFDALRSVTGTGHFHAEGEFDYLPLGLEVAGLGELGFPLHPMLAQALIQVAEVAPYGKGSETIIDEAVRKCWQVDAGQLSFRNPLWDVALGVIVKQVAQAMGVEGEVSASLYKLLIYEEGGRFLPHKDTEKEEAMFGSLIIALPSRHEGGELMIRHAGQNVCVDFSKENPESKVRYAAFYADCEHEVVPVTSGYRICLVYNLCQQGCDLGEMNQSVRQQADRIAPYLEEYDLDGLSAILLDHQYTEANFGVQALKNHDLIRAQALICAANEAGYDAHLALFEHYQNGSLLEDYYGDADDEPEDETMDELFDEGYSISHWLKGDGTDPGFSRWNVSEDCIITDKDLEAEEPIEKHAEGYTGNAGCTVDYWYRHAAVVLWPRSQRAETLVQYDFTGTCRYLATSADQCTAAEFRDLAREIMARLPNELSKYDNSPISDAITAMVRHSSELIPELLQSHGAALLCLDSAVLWRELVQAQPSLRWVEFIHPIQEKDKPKCRRGAFFLLRALVVASQPVPVITEFVTALLQKYPKVGLPASLESYSMRERAPVQNTEECLTLLEASECISCPQTRQAILVFLERDMSLVHVRETLALALLSPALIPESYGEASLTPCLVERVIAVLQDEVDREILPYADWARPCPAIQAGSSSYFRRGLEQERALELQKFMEDPHTKTYDFRYNEEIRRALTDKIAELGLDLTHETLTTGRPYTLRCHKTNKSYEKALKTRDIDLQTLQQLREKWRKGEF